MTNRAFQGDSPVTLPRRDQKGGCVLMGRTANRKITTMIQFELFSRENNLTHKHYIEVASLQVTT